MSTPAASPRSNPIDDRGPSYAWKEELNARLREHRQRRGQVSSSVGANTLSKPLEGYRRAPGGNPPSSRIAARVAERYSHVPSYQELLTASAAAAAIAAETALEAHAAAQAVLSSWEASSQPASQSRSFLPSNELATDGFVDPFSLESEPLDKGLCAQETAPVVESVRVAFPAANAALPLAAVTVEHHAPLPERTVVPERLPIRNRARSLVDAFAEAVVPAAQSLPAKLIEFPRELIAPRKQRPRIAEGPLLEQELPSMSLRIFEVVEEVTEKTGAAVQLLDMANTADSMEFGELVPVNTSREQHLDGEYGVAAEIDEREYKDQVLHPHENFYYGSEQGTAQREKQQSIHEESGWGSIRLGEHPQTAAPATAPVQPLNRRPEHGYKLETAPALHELAPISDRFMAALVDGGLVFACFLLSVLVFASCTTHPPSGKAAVAVATLVFGVLATFYGWLFMSFGGGSTPGMRYARIALCTFRDENPTRKELKARIPATALALLPLGLGVFWALLDENKLGWHDRMTRTYQRSYR